MERRLNSSWVQVEVVDDLLRPASLRRVQHVPVALRNPLGVDGTPILEHRWRARLQRDSSGQALC